MIGQGDPAMIEQHREFGRRGRRSPAVRRLWRFLVFVLFVLAICAVLLKVYRSFPLETLVIAGMFVVAGVGIVLYIGELVVLGWVVDFLSEIGMPEIRATPIPLEYEQVGEIVVVKLRDNVGTVRQCQSVQKQLKHLIDEQHCDVVLDFSRAGRVSRSFRGVMVYVMKAARRAAGKLGKPYRPVALPHGAVFKVFDDREGAVEKMSKHDGHGWVVLCSVPVGIRAVAGN